MSHRSTSRSIIKSVPIALRIETHFVPLKYRYRYTLRYKFLPVLCLISGFGCWPAAYHLLSGWPCDSRASPGIFPNLMCPSPRPAPPRVHTISLGSPLFGDVSHWRSLFGFALVWNGTDVTYPHGYTCRLVNSSTRADAVVFFGRETTDEMLYSLSRNRTTTQRWVFLSSESTRHSQLPFSRSWYQTFNWTATYRRDSDFWLPYVGNVETVESIPLSVPPRPRRLAFAVISNCEPRYRLNIVNRLQSILPEVDLFGQCGDLGMVSPGPENIWKLSENYFFYLAFENSYCLDYITEKFWTNGLHSSAVPVVLGGLSRAEYDAVAPPNSFIYAHDFSSVRALGMELKRLSVNATAYDEYHHWRRRYRVTAAHVGQSFVSDLCYRLSTDNMPKVVNIASFWSLHHNCDLRDDVLLAG